jgi:hypothetical protein
MPIAFQSLYCVERALYLHTCWHVQEIELGWTPTLIEENEKPLKKHRVPTKLAHYAWTFPSMNMVRPNNDLNSHFLQQFG